MAVVTYTPTNMWIEGLHNNAITYYWIVPSGSSVTDHAFFGPVDSEAGDQFCVQVSANPSVAGNGPLITIYGTMSGQGTTPSARAWGVVRGDTASAANVALNAVTCSMINVLTPARSYRIRVSAGVNAAVSSAIRVRATIYRVGTSR